MTDEPDLETKVAKWLRDQGYPLELRIARALESAGVRAHHSRLYADPNSGTYREIDLIAFANEANFSTHLMIECKSGTKPWVAFRSTTSMLSEYGLLMATGIATRSAYDSMCRLGDTRPTLTGYGLFDRRWKPAFNVVEAFKDGADVAYRAVESALAAAGAWSRPDRRNRILSLPVVVLSAPLFEASVNETGEVSLHRVDRAVLLRAPTVGDDPSTHPRFVDIVTEEAFPAFVADAVDWGEQLALLTA